METQNCNDCAFKDSCQGLEEGCFTSIPVVGATLSWHCPHCDRNVDIRMDDLVVVVVAEKDANGEYPTKIHLYAKCPGCKSKVEIRRS